LVLTDPSTRCLPSTRNPPRSCFWHASGAFGGAAGPPRVFGSFWQWI
jgi:hypothetical protein